MKDILHRINNLYSDELNAVQHRIQSLVELQRNEETKRHLNYVVSKPGHMLRPLIAFMSFGSVYGRSFDELDPIVKTQLIDIAAALELLHTASLIHDDVIDHTLERRRQPTVNAVTGNTEAVLIGNLFYINAFRLMLSLGDPWYLNTMIKTAEDMCIGEVLQNEKQNRILSKEEYLEIIQLKTGVLISSAAKLAVYLANSEQKQALHYENLALTLGTLYQLRDDYADQDLQNFNEKDLQNLLKEKTDLLVSMLPSLNPSTPHQRALIEIIHYFKG